MFRLWLRDLFPAVSRPAPRAAARRARPQVLSLEDRVTPAVLSIADATLIEGNAGGTSMTFTVTLDVADPVNPTSFDFTTIDGTATTADADYALSAGTVTIPATQTTGTFTVTINGDATVEADETFTAMISNPVNATIGKATGTGTITNDDTTTLTLTPSAAATAEGASITYTVTSSNAVQGGFSVAVSATPNAPATAGDITLSGGTLTFAGGIGEPQQFTVLAVADGVVEPTETFDVALGTVTPNQAIFASKFVAAGSPVTSSITDADTTTLTVSNVTQNENAGSMTFTVTSSNPVQGGFTVNAKTLDGSALAASDYTAKTSMLTFVGNLANEGQTFVVPITPDTVVEDDEIFTVTLNTPAPNDAGIAASKVAATGVGTGTILNDDTTTLTIDSPAGVVEGGNVVFTLTLSNALDVAVTVTVSTGNTGPTTDADHAVLTNFVAVIPAGMLSVTVSVATIDDAVVEPTEQFTLSIVTATAPGRTVTVGPPATGTATITDNDTTTLSISPAANTTAEGGSITYTVTSSNEVQGGFSVGIAATPNAPATAADFTSGASPLVFAGGVGEKQFFTVTAFDDAIVEPTETFAVTLGTVTPNQAIATAKFTLGAPAAGTITDNDTTTLTVEDVSLALGRGASRVDVLRGVSI